jgi:hypothetical protein
VNAAELIFQALGGHRQGTGFVVHCPVPTHGQGRGDRSPSLKIQDGDERLLVKCHAGCETRDVLAELRRRGLLEDARRDLAPAPARQARQPPARDADVSRRALAIWHEAQDPRGTIVERYLAGRGLELPIAVASEVLRFHPRCPWETGAAPAVVALYRDIVTDQPAAIHRTALTADGQKLGRKMLGPVAGAAIKLDPDVHVSLGLVIGEGIETCLAARQIGFRPVWALGSAGAIGSFPVTPGLEALTILAEHDAANAKAVRACGERWSAAGREVIVVEPLSGKDVNDAIRGAA